MANLKISKLQQRLQQDFQELPLIVIKEEQLNGDDSKNNSNKPKTYLDRFKQQFQASFDSNNKNSFRRGSHFVQRQQNDISNTELLLNPNNNQLMPYPYPNRVRSQSFNGGVEEQETKYILDLGKEEDQKILKNTLQMRDQITDFQIDMLKRTFSPLKIFTDLEKQMKKEEYKNMFQNLHFHKLQKGSVVFEYGDIGDKYFIIVKGSVYVLLKTNYGETVRKMKTIEDEDSKYVCKSEPSENRREKVSQFGKKNTLHIDNFQDDANHTLDDIYTRRSRATTADFEVDSEPDYEAKGVVLKSEIKQKYPQFSIVANHFEGEGFGEYSLIKNIRRTATIIASTDTIFLTMDKNEYNEILKDHIEAIFQRKIQFLKTFKIFESLEKKLSNLVMCFQSIYFQRGDIIYNEQDDSHSLYFIQNGEIEISSYEYKLYQRQEEQEEERQDDQTKEMNRLLLNSSQKQKRVKKRQTLAILNDKNYFGEDEIILKQKKRFTQAKVISAQFSGLKISLKNFMLLCKYTDVMRRLRQNYKIKKQWRDSYQNNCVEIKYKFNQNNQATSSFSPNKIEYSSLNNSQINSPNKNLIRISSRHNQSKNSMSSNSPNMRQTKLGQFQDLSFDQLKQYVQSKNQQNDQILPSEIFQNQFLQSYTPLKENQSQYLNNTLIQSELDKTKVNNKSNLINIKAILGKEHKKDYQISMNTISQQFNFSKSLSPIMRNKNVSVLDSNQVSLDQTDLNKSTQNQTSQFSPLGRVLGNTYNNSNLFSGYISSKSPINTAQSSLEGNHKNFKLNLNQLGNSTEVTPRNNNLYDKNHEQSQIGQPDTFNVSTRFKSLPQNTLKASNQDQLKTYLSSLQQSFYDNSFLHTPIRKAKQLRSNSTTQKNNKEVNLSELGENANENLKELNKDEIKYESLEEMIMPNIQNQGYSYYKYVLKNEEGCLVKKGKKAVEYISNKDHIDDLMLMKEYTQKFNNNQTIEQKYGITLQNNSHLRNNYQKIHQKLCVNENLAKVNEKGRKMIQYYNDVQKNLTSGQKKFISPFKFYKDKNKEASVFQNAYMNIDPKRNSANKSFATTNIYGIIRRKSLETVSKFQNNEIQNNSFTNSNRDKNQLMFVNTILISNFNEGQNQTKKEQFLKISPARISQYNIKNKRNQSRSQSRK